MGHYFSYNVIRSFLNCQSEVRIFGVKNEIFNLNINIAKILKLFAVSDIIKKKTKERYHEKNRFVY